MFELGVHSLRTKTKLKLFGLSVVVLINDGRLPLLFLFQKKIL